MSSLFKLHRPINPLVALQGASASSIRVQQGEQHTDPIHRADSLGEYQYERHDHVLRG